MLGGADNPNGELPSYITGADSVEFVQDGNRKFLVLPYGKSAEVIPFQGKEWVHLKE